MGKRRGLGVGTLLLGGLLMGAVAGSVAGCGDDSGQNNNQVPDWTVGTVLNWVDQGVLAEVEAPYGPVKILRLQGSHYDMGYQYGYLMADEVQDVWDNLFGPLIAEELEIDPVLASDIFNVVMDQAWNHVLPNTPQIFLDELDGVEDGARDAGHPNPEWVVSTVRRIMMLVDTSQAEAFSGDIGDLTRFFSRGVSRGFEEYFELADAGDPIGHEQQLALQGAFVPRPFRERLAQIGPSPSCSFFAVWGDRTEDGRQVASRVLDWAADMGLNDYALITVFVPDGAAAYVAVGYAGMLSILAGMNEHGIALGAVGSSTALDRLKTESISLKGRELLEFSENLDEIMPYLSGELGDGIIRAPSIGTVVMVSYGDPGGAGVAAEGAVSEFNGVFASAYRYGSAPTCEESAFLFEFDLAGELAATYNHVDHPDLANLEGDAYEIDRDGNIRTFLVDANQEFVYDATSGELVDDASGLPYPVGFPYPCALYRADPAMNLVVRRYQTAANGPADPDRTNILMHLSGAYANRHKPQGDMIDAYYHGTGFVWDGVELIADTGTRQPIGIEEAKDIIWVVAMASSNTFSVVYDTTNLVLHVAYESGTGPTWKRAADNEYLSIDLADLLPADR